VVKLYSSKTKDFPYGTKLRLIPTIGSIISQESKEEYGLAMACQAVFSEKSAWDKLGLFQTYSWIINTRNLDIH
jgi:hypothetical protein